MTDPKAKLIELADKINEISNEIGELDISVQGFNTGEAMGHLDWAARHLRVEADRD